MKESTLNEKSIPDSQKCDMVVMLKGISSYELHVWLATENSRMILLDSFEILFMFVLEFDGCSFASFF